MDLREELMRDTSASCKLCAFLASLHPVMLGEWQRALKEPVEDIGNMAVTAALHRRGVDISERSVRRHRANHQ